MAFLRFDPILKSTIWGGEKIIPFKGLDIEQAKVGESWELSGVAGDESVVSEGEFKGMTIVELIEKFKGELIGEKNFERFGLEFPLLIKFIDAREPLSIQVHPDDKLSMERHNKKGKTEMWYVIDADKDATLKVGFSEQITPEEYEQRITEDTITDVLDTHEITPGDLFFLPAGRIHSIGAGAFIAEIQQTSDVTYRIYDFNRTDAAGNPRELHTELSKEAINYEVLPEYKTIYDKAKNQEVLLAECDYFTTKIYDLDAPVECDYSALDSFVVAICVEGAADLTSDDGQVTTIEKGQMVLLPATTASMRIVPNGSVKILTSYVE